MPATRIIHVSSNSCHILDDPCIHPSFKLEVVCFRVSLISHLSSQVRTFKGSLHQQFRLIESTGQRFFHIHVFAGSQSQHTDREVRVIRSSNCYSIKLVTSLVKHLAEVSELFRFRIHAHHLSCMFSSHVYITQSHNLYHTRTCKILYNLLSTVSNANIGYFYLFISSFFR